MKNPKLSVRDRSIARREIGIRDLEQRKADLRQRAEEKCAQIDKLIATRLVLLAAIKSGALTP